MATPYLTLATLKPLSVMPSGDLDALESASPGWIDTQLQYWSSQIEARLAKRYRIPFDVPYPMVITGWLARIVTVRCYLRRGVDPSDLQFAEIKADADAAWAEIKEAADAVTGLYDLPLRADTASSGISRGGTLAYSEASPHVWMDVQVGSARDEDSNGGGTFR